MRTLFIIIVLGALGYLGWVYREEIQTKIATVTSGQTAPDEEAATPDATTPAPSVAPPAPAATPAPKSTAPPGSFYMKQRVSVEIPTGIKALNAGELVKLVYRNKDGTARVTTGKDEMVVKESLLTADPAEIGK